MRKIILITILILSITIIGCSQENVPPHHFTPDNITAWKSHTLSTLTLTANMWLDIKWEEKIEEESLEGISYLNEGTIDEDRSILVIEGYDDIFNIQGCVHSLWTGPTGQSSSIATRIVSSIDNGTTWEESRCLQYFDYSERGAGAEGTHPYSGTLSVNQTTWLKLQVQVSNDDLILQSHPVFDKPVSSTIYMNNIGSRR